VPPSAFLKFADFVFTRARKAALAVAKHFRFDQLFGDGRAVYLHKGHGAAGTAGVKRARHKFFARAAFTVNQHTAIGGSRECDLLPQGLHGNAAAEDLVFLFELGAEAAIFVFEARVIERIARGENHFAERQRLFDEIEGSKLCGADGGFDIAVAGNHDDQRSVIAGLNLGERFDPVNFFEPHVEQNEVKAAAINQFEALLAGGDTLDFVAFVAQEGAERLAYA